MVESKLTVVKSDVKTARQAVGEKQLRLWTKQQTPAVADVDKKWKQRKVDIKTAQTTALHRAKRRVLEGTNY